MAADRDDVWPLPPWGIGPIATDPDAWPTGRPRRRLVRAATLTGVMGAALGGPQLASTPPPTPEQVAGTIEQALPDDPEASPLTDRQEGRASDHDRAVHAARAGAASEAPGPDSGQQRPTGAWKDNVIAAYEDVDIVQPSPEVRMVGFHEGGFQANDVRPSAKPDRDLGSEAVDSVDREGSVPSMVLPTRDRGTGAATAIDIAMPEGEKVYAPITGTVTAANRYSLYGKYPDTIITIQPDGRDDVMMEILHVDGAKVEVGDRVVAGKTVIADTPNRLPFSSQIDRFATEKGKALPTPTSRCSACEH